MRHSGRLFLGYNNSISETLTFDTGVDVAGTDYWETLVQFHLLY